jgi:hypothetical protein
MLLEAVSVSVSVGPRKFGRWQQRFGEMNGHNVLVPRDHQIEDWITDCFSATDIVRKSVNRFR